jgi:hypothetical protein
MGLVERRWCSSIDRRTDLAEVMPGGCAHVCVTTAYAGTTGASA